MESDADIFAAGNCYDAGEYKHYSLFCPYAHRSSNNSSVIIVKDLSIGYKYDGSEDGSDYEFFEKPRENAHKKLASHYNISIGKIYVAQLCCGIKVKCTSSNCS